MKRLAAIALILTAVAIPASAQRGASRGGFSGRAPSSAPAFHSSPSFSGISRAPMSTPRPAPNARPSFYSANRYPGNRYPIGRPVGNRYPIRRPIPFRNFGYGYPSGTSYVPYPFLDSPFYDDEPHLGADHRTLYFSSDRVIPVHFPRTHDQAKKDLDRLNSWDNSNSNIWSIQLPLDL